MNTFKPRSTQKVKLYFVDWVEFYLGTIWSLGYNLFYEAKHSPFFCVLFTWTFMLPARIAGCLFDFGLLSGVTSCMY